MPAKTVTDAADFVQLQFGTHGGWQLPRLETTASISPPVLPVDDLTAVIDKALGSPLGLPSLDLVIVPGDTVALAVDPSLPALADVVGRVVLWLCDHGMEPANLKIVIASHAPQLATDV